MAAERIIRRLRSLLDVDDTGIAQGDVPTWDVPASSFTMAPPGAASGHSVTLSGNTAGALALISTGTWTLAGGANITLSQAGNAVTISGGAGGAGGTAISGISASDTLYTSGTVRFTGVGGGITVSSNTGQRIDLSVAAPVAQSVQTQSLVNLTLNGNTSGALALMSSGTVSLAGGNNITLSQAGNAVTISAASQSVQPETQTFIAGISASDTLYTSGNVRFTGAGAVTVASGTGQQVIISAPTQSVQPETQTFIGGISASDTLYTSGSVRFTGVGGGVTVSSNTGQRVDISVAAPVAQTVQTQNVVDVTLSGNTAGALALISSGTMTLAGGNNITVSQAGNAVTISGPNVGGAQTGISGFANSETTYTSGSVTLSELGAITIRSTTGQQFQFSVNAQSVQPETQTFLGGLGNSQTTYTSGTVNLSVLAGNLTIRSTTGQAFQFSVSQSVQAETQTFIAGISASDTLYTSGNVRITGVGGGITVSSNTGQRIDLSVAAPVAQTAQTGISGIANSQTTYTSGTVTLSELGAITIRSTTGNQYQLSVNAQTTQTQGILSMGVSTGGNTLGNTQVSTGSRMVIVASGALTASQATAAGASTITLSAASQTVQTQNMHNVTLSGNSTSAGAGYIQISSGTMTLAGGNNVTLSQNGNAVTISAGGGAETQTAISGIANSQTTYTSGTVSLSELGAITIRSTTGNQFQFSVNSQSAQTQSNIQALYDGANSISTGTVRLTDANGVTFSVNAQTLSASVNQSISMFAVSNTTQSTSGTAHKSALSFAGAGVASVGVTGGSVVISVPAGGGAGFSAGASNLGNTAGSTGITGTNLIFVGTNAVSLSQSTDANGGTVSINVAAPQTLTSFNAYENAQWAAPALQQGSLHIQPYQFNANVQHDRVVLPMSYSQATNSTLTVTLSVRLGLYTKNASTLSLLSSTSGTQSINGSGTASSSVYVGQRLLTLPWTNTVTEGNYYIGYHASSSTAGANATLGFYAISQFQTTVQFSGILGQGSATSGQLSLGLGHFSVTTASLPDSLEFSEIQGTGSAGNLRAPVLWFVSGTA